MAETALNFGPDWLRALAHGSTSTHHPQPLNVSTVPKYSLAQFRYGREEMLVLIPKDPKKPEFLKNDTSKVVKDIFTLPLALIPHTEDEQRLWSRSVNSDAVLRASGKSIPGNNMGRSGRGGSVDRGRGRGRGGYYQRGITYEDTEDGTPAVTGFSRPKPIERSQSASEKDQRWDERDRRFDRHYSGRSGCSEDNMVKSEQSRSNEYWRKLEKEEDTDWRSNLRSDKLGPRGSWRNPVDKERRDIERNPSSRSLNGNLRNSHPHQKTSGNHLPEWSVDESNEQDVVGTFDSSGAFLESKMTENNLDEVYVSDDADEGQKNSPEAKKDNSKKTPKKSNSQPQVVSSHQNLKQSEITKPELLVDKQPSQISEPSINSNTKIAVNKTADHVITSSIVVQHNIVNNKLDYIPVTLPNVPDVKSTKSETVIHSHVKKSEASVPVAAIEEDAFAHHKKATENMVAQWTEEEEQRVISQSPSHEGNVKNIWYYQDPQGEIQGPFTSPEMLEWFTAGYFAMGLMVRRTCDEKFSQLGELIKSWGRVPFMPGDSPPPIRVPPPPPPPPTSLPTPVTQAIVPNPVAAPVTNPLPKQEDQLLAIQQQLLQQQLMQQQLMLRQAQLQQLLAQLKQQDNFTSLNTQQQQQVLMQQFMAQQQMPRNNATDQPGLVETIPPPLPLPILSLPPMAPVLKNDLPLWNMTPTSNPWPLNVNAPQPSNVSIWDIDSKQNSEENELKQQQIVKEQELQRKSEEERIAQEKEEEKRKLEELRRKQEEERQLIELQRQEEEKKKLEEQKRLEEEMRRQEELRRIEEQKRKEEELRKQREEELRRIEEQKRKEEELRKQREEELRRMEELRRKEEECRLAELRKQEELRKLEEKRKKEEMQKKLEMEKERARLEFEKQKEAAMLKEMEKEREQQLQREREKEEEMRRLAEIKLKSQQGPAWGIQKTKSETLLSLADIQRLQEEKEREEREERIKQQLLQQKAIQQAQQNKNGLSWAKRSADTLPAVKSLAEIQQEEAERLTQQQKNQKPQAPAPVINSNVGVWGNPSHLNRIAAAPPNWSINNVATSGFWDDAISSPPVRKQTPKSNDSAFPALINPEKPATATVHSNKSKNVRAKKEEDAVTKLFGNRKPTDEFTTWCTEALSSMPSSVDVPTFVAFLKDVESPYEVHDYVRSYLGDGKEQREFARQFLDKRSKFRAKQIPVEENTLWGPAPAVNPIVNKSSNSQPSNDNDGNSNAKGKSKRRKNKMQKLDSSMLGFTVQSNPDRLNVGEIDHVEGM